MARRGGSRRSRNGRACIWPYRTIEPVAPGLPHRRDGSIGRNGYRRYTMLTWRRGLVARHAGGRRGGYARERNVPKAQTAERVILTAPHCLGTATAVVSTLQVALGRQHFELHACSPANHARHYAGRGQANEYRTLHAVFARERQRACVHVKKYVDEE